MPFMPFTILGIWFRGVLAIAIVSGGIYLLKLGYDAAHNTVPIPVVSIIERPVNPNADDSERGRTAAAPLHRVFRFEPGMNRQTAYVASGVALLSLAFVGGLARRFASMMLGGPKTAPGTVADEPRDQRTGDVHRINRPDGTELRVECYGPPEAPPIVMTHGWGCDSTEWFYAKQNLASRFRLILWDEPGLGLSKKPGNNDFSVEKLAADLEAVLRFAGDRPAILVGHSIGGMITLTFCKNFHESLGRRVAGLVLAHTSYTNPIRTTKMAGFYTALEKPVVVPLLHLTIGLWPLVWVMNWLSYLNGSAHRSTRKDSFAGTETRGQLDFFARFMPRGRPDVLARGMLGMIRYDASETLPRICVPTLVIVGDQDATTLPEAGRHIARNVSGARLATLSPAKHLGLIEQHDRFDELVAEFADAVLEASVTL
jgi:pimeloyl-ACP methyl ester carboxylesterase